MPPTGPSPLRVWIFRVVSVVVVDGEVTGSNLGNSLWQKCKGSFSYKLPADDALRGCQVASNVGDISQNSIMASTLLGSIIIFIPLSREEYDLLEAVQARLVVHPLTAPILGNDHTEYRSRGSMRRSRKALDGDMLAQFLELTSMQQEAVLALPLGAQNTITFNSKQSPAPITVNQVVRLLERIHYALN